MFSTFESVPRRGPYRSRATSVALVGSTLFLSGCDRPAASTTPANPPPVATAPSNRPAVEHVASYDADKAQRHRYLIERLNRNGDISNPATPRPLLTLEEFFEGNDDPGSIGYNLANPPSPAQFYTLFKYIRERPEVADVRIEINDLPDPEGWPSTDTVWIITRATREAISGWIPAEMRPDDFLLDFNGLRTVEPYQVPAGMRAIGLWWD